MPFTYRELLLYCFPQSKDGDLHDKVRRLARRDHLSRFTLELEFVELLANPAYLQRAFTVGDALVPFSAPGNIHCNFLCACDTHELKMLQE